MLIKGIAILFALCVLLVLHGVLNPLGERLISLPNALYRRLFERRAKIEDADWNDDGPIHPQ